MKKTPQLFFLSFLFFFCLSLSGQENPAPDRTSFMEWLQDQPGEVTLVLETDLAYLYENRRKQAYQPALFSVNHATEPLQLEVNVKTRGKFRCIRCDLPPLKLKFEKDTLRAAGFRKWNELKIVLPCMEGRKFDQWLLKEYLTYRLYNLLTDYSFRVKLVNIQLRDPGNPELNREYMAFLIEHEEETANRLQADAYEEIPIDVSQLSSRPYTLYQVFQFMIGNTDWIPLTGHNLTALKTKDDQLIPLPFDFDFSGLVHTDYALPRTETGLTDVQDRFFMGNNKSPEELETTFVLFRRQQSAMYDLINQFEPLDKSERKKMIQFLDSFFSIIDKPREVNRYFLDRPVYMEGMY